MSCYFGPILTPLPPCHTSSHISGPPKVCHSSRTPQFLVVHAYIHTYVLVRKGFWTWGFVWGFLSGRFCPRWFLLVSPSVRIHPLQQKAKHHFQLQVSYVWNFFKSALGHALGPPTPCHKLSHLLGPPLPQAWCTLWMAPHHFFKVRILGDCQSRDSRMTAIFRRSNLFGLSLMTKVTLTLIKTDRNAA